MVEKTHASGWLPNLYEPLRNLGARISDWFAPASEAGARRDSYTITLELPGVDSDAVEIAVNDTTLTISGEKTAHREEKGATWYFSERQYGAFSRSFRLPPDADADAIRAEMKDGVLEISIPKLTPSEPARRTIAITKA